jgi:hypothetical protein
VHVVVPYRVMSPVRAVWNHRGSSKERQETKPSVVFTLLPFHPVLI